MLLDLHAGGQALLEQHAPDRSQAKSYSEDEVAVVEVNHHPVHRVFMEPALLVRGIHNLHDTPLPVVDHNRVGSLGLRGQDGRGRGQKGTVSHATILHYRAAVASPKFL